MDMTKRTKKILVTGGAGFIGSHLIERLLKDPATKRVICVDNLDESYPVTYKRSNISAFRSDTRFVFYKTDIRDTRKLQRIFSNEKPDFVVHLAAKTDTRTSLVEPLLYESVNVAGTISVLECAKVSGVKKCVTISSSSVYGNAVARQAVKEDTTTDYPLSHYGATKKAGEVIAHSYAYNFDMTVICIRLFNVYGERMRPGPVLYTWVDQLFKGSPVSMSGRGERRRDFTYVGDVVDAILKALRRGTGYGIFNVASSNPASLSELLKVVETAVGKKARVAYRPKNRASIESSYADIRKAQTAFGWNPKTSLTDGVKRFVTWFRDHRIEHDSKRP
jgi:UDP-glucuronate 4-epimerase